MADNSLTIDRNRFLALVLKSPTQMGWLSIINSVTNISRLGNFNNDAAFVLFPNHKPFLLGRENGPAFSLSVKKWRIRNFGGIT